MPPARRDRFAHRGEVEAFLRDRFPSAAWSFTAPKGTGHETYFARGTGGDLFVKLGSDPERVRLLAGLGLTPPMLAEGALPDGTSILVQPRLEGRAPTRADYLARLEDFAGILHATHSCAPLHAILPAPAFDDFRSAGSEALGRLRRRWETFRPAARRHADFVDRSLDRLAGDIDAFGGEGLVPCHRDPCNANWLLTRERLYLLDLDSMGLDDPALDLGATLWWYLPPSHRDRFLERAGCPTHAAFKARMRARMALHSLTILLPRERSFDAFNLESFTERLEDFRALMEGRENPQGYN